MPSMRQRFRPKLPNLSRPFQHHLISVRETGIVPEWAFCDEDFNGRIVKVETHKCHTSTLGSRVALKWSAQFALQAQDELFSG